MSRTRSARVPRRLHRDRILRAAVRLADVEGLEALTMRRLAETLSVQAMSLYNHVAGKDDLLDGIVDLVVSEIDAPPASAYWKAALRQRMLSAHAVLCRHPWATLVIVSRANAGPAMLTHIEATLACLREAGFPGAIADHAWNALDSHLYGFTLQALNFPFDPAEYREVAKAYASQLPPERYPNLGDLTHEVAEGRHDGRHEFGFGLDLILDGLEQRLGEARTWGQADPDGHR